MKMAQSAFCCCSPFVCPLISQGDKQWTNLLLLKLRGGRALAWLTRRGVGKAFVAPGGPKARHHLHAQAVNERKADYLRCLRVQRCATAASASQQTGSRVLGIAKIFAQAEVNCRSRRRMLFVAAASPKRHPAINSSFATSRH